MIRAGTTFLSPSRHGGKRHFLIVLSDEDEDGKAAIVGLTTYREGVDDTVRVSPNDYPSLRHDSAVCYADARVARVDKLADGADDSTMPSFGWAESVSDGLLEQIQDGIFKSRFVPRDVRSYCRMRWGEESS